MRPDKDLRIRYLVFGFFVTLPFFLCSLMEVAG